jgi:hypothetical protein
MDTHRTVSSLAVQSTSISVEPQCIDGGIAVVAARTGDQ